jgi:hypothetical protein
MEKMNGILWCMRKSNNRELLNILYESIIYNLNLDVPARINYYISKNKCNKKKCKNRIYNGFFLYLNEKMMTSSEYHEVIYHDDDLSEEWEEELLRYEFELHNYDNYIKRTKMFIESTQ